MKSELWNLTAGWRGSEAGNSVLRFEPAVVEGSIAINPLSEIRFETPNEVGDAQNIANIIVDPEGKGMVDHWAKTVHAFLTGCLLHLLYKKKASGDQATLFDGTGGKTPGMAQLATTARDISTPDEASKVTSRRVSKSTAVIVSRRAQCFRFRPIQLTASRHARACRCSAGRRSPPS
jgi:type IV secretory pathway TraG/TraD family ATPase VirD4